MPREQTMSIRFIERETLLKALASRAGWQESGADTRGMHGAVEKGDG